VHAPNTKNPFHYVKAVKTNKHHKKRIVKDLVKLESARASYTITQPPIPPGLVDINRLHRLRRHNNRKNKRPPSKVNGRHVNDVKPPLKPEELVQSTQPQPHNIKRRRDNMDVPKTKPIKQIILNLVPPTQGTPPTASKTFPVPLSAARFREVSTAGASSQLDASERDTSIASATADEPSDAALADMIATSPGDVPTPAHAPAHVEKQKETAKEQALDKQIISLFASSDPGMAIPI